MKRKKTKFFTSIEQFDYTLLFLVAFLAGFGLLMIYSASSYTSQMDYGDPEYYFKKQLFNLALGAVVLFITMKFNFKKLKGGLSIFIFIVSLVCIALVKTPLGITSHGASRWLNFKIFSFQPAELAKLAVILLLATIICNMGSRMAKVSSVIKLWIIAAIPAAMILVLTKNMSSALIVAGIAFVMAFVAHRKKGIFIGIVAVIGVAVVALIVILNTMDMSELTNFRLERIVAWLEPERYADDTGYQTLQALYAIGSGGLFGKGLGSSLQKLDFVPEAQNDMIFSIICEELGLFGALVLIAVFVLLLWRIANIALNAKDLFGSMVAVGVFGHIAIQVVLNVAVVTNLIPNTGVSLPFISYGGTSVLFLMAEMGIVLNISANANRSVAGNSQEEMKGTR